MLKMNKIITMSVLGGILGAGLYMYFTAPKAIHKSKATVIIDGVTYPLWD